MAPSGVFFSRGVADAAGVEFCDLDMSWLWLFALGVMLIALTGGD